MTSDDNYEPEPMAEASASIGLAPSYYLRKHKVPEPVEYSRAAKVIGALLLISFFVLIILLALT